MTSAPSSAACLPPVNSRRWSPAAPAGPNASRRFSPSETCYTSEGLASPIRFRGTDRLEFVVRCLMQPRGFERLPLPPSLWRDPLNFELLRVDASPERGLRELVLGQRGFINSNGSSGVFVYVRAWADYSFLLRPGEPLTPGEYAFKYGVNQTEARELFCFGIDA